MLEKLLGVPWTAKEIESVNPKGNQSWTFIGRTDAEAEAPIFWPPDVKSQLIGKDPDAGKDWRQEEKGTTEDEMVGWHHWLTGCEFEQTKGDSEGQETLEFCRPWGQKRVGHHLATEQQQRGKEISQITGDSVIYGPIILLLEAFKENFHFFSPNSATPRFSGLEQSLIYHFHFLRLDSSTYLILWVFSELCTYCMIGTWSLNITVISTVICFHINQSPSDKSITVFQI